MQDETAIELLQESARRFASAGVSWNRARFGIHGIWVGGSLDASGLSSLAHAQQAETLWSEQLGISSPNPYSPIVELLLAGGYIGRWENRVLDIKCPSGLTYGVPETHFARASTRG